MTVDTRPGTSRRTTVPRWLWVAFAGAALIYGIPSLWFLASYMQPPYDLGIYDQALWLLAHGDSLITIAGVHVNSAHFSPILYLLSPIAHVPGGASPELVLQAFLIASGIFPAWLLARSLNQDGRWFVLVYAIHPAIVGGSWFGWRPWNIAVPLFMWMTWWVVKNPTWARISLAGLALLVFREDLAVWIGLLAIVLLIAGRLNWKTLVKSGLVLGSASALIVLIVLPALSFVDGYYFASSTQTLGGSVSELSASAIARVIFLLAPLAVMPRLLDWRLLAPLGIPVAGLLIRGGNSLTTFFHYDMMFVPLLLCVVGLSTKVDFKPLVLAVASLLVLFGLGALRPFAPQGTTNPFLYDSQVKAELDQVKTAIDSYPDVATASMSVPGLLVPHYSERSNIFIYPFPVDVWRDSDGREAPLSIRFDCPQPTIVAAREAMNRPPWREVLTESYSLLSEPGLPFGVWLRGQPLGDEPCTATRVYTR